MPVRLLREGILDSAAVNALSLPAEVFYRRLMSVVDDFGRFDGRAAVLRGRLYSLKLNDVREADITRWIAECEKAGLIALYAVDDKPYILFHRLGPARAKESKFPAPPTGGANGRAHLQTDESNREQPRACAPYSYSGSDSGSGAGSATHPAEPDDPETDPPPKPDDVIAAWNAVPGLPPFKGTNPNMRRNIAARWTDPRFRSRWRDVIAALGKSEWHTGRAGNGDDPFVATLTWFLGEQGFDKAFAVLERHEAKPAPPPSVGRNPMLDCGPLDGMKMTGSKPFASPYRGGGSHGL